jgi:hypothetical protein
VIDGTIQLSANPVALAGDQAGAQAGFSVASLGDVNDDGVDDIGIGAPARNSKKGSAFVVFGRSSGWASATLPAGGITLDEDGTAAQGGFAIATAGDLDGDGIDDFAVSAPYRSSQTLTEAGRMYLIYGKSGLNGGQLSSVAEANADGVQNYVWLGYSLSGGFDVDARGGDDLLLGAPWPTTVALGYLMILPNKTTRYTRTISPSDLVKVGGNTDNWLGSAVAALGPVESRDNYGDLIVAGMNANGAGPHVKDSSGMVYFIPGSTKLTPSDTNLAIDSVSTAVWNGDGEDELAGYSVANAGDVNGDGFNDFLMSVGKQVSSSPGLAYLTLGGTLPPSGTIQSAADVTFTGEGSGCPCIVSGVGDLNGDGLGDFAVGISHATAGGTDSGAVYLFFGAASGLSGTKALSTAADVFVGAAGDRAGSSIAPAGDLNDDGYDDFLIGAPGADVGGLTDAGRVYVVFGFKP